jgi:hypothetical protein
MKTITAYRFLGRIPGVALVREMLAKFDEVFIGSAQVSPGMADAEIESLAATLAPATRPALGGYRRPAPMPRREREREESPGLDLGGLMDELQKELNRA